MPSRTYLQGCPLTLNRHPPCSTYCCKVAGSLKPGGPSPDTSCSTPSTCTAEHASLSLRTHSICQNQVLSSLRSSNVIPPALDSAAGGVTQALNLGAPHGSLPVHVRLPCHQPTRALPAAGASCLPGTAGALLPLWSNLRAHRAYLR